MLESNDKTFMVILVFAIHMAEVQRYNGDGKCLYVRNNVNRLHYYSIAATGRFRFVNNAEHVQSAQCFA